MVREEAVQRTNTEANVKDCCKSIVAAVCTGILCIIILLSILFFVCGVTITATYPHCAALYFGTEKPNTITLPDLRNLSSSEWNSLLAGRYKLSRKYKLKLTEDTGIYSLCVLKRHFTHVSACVEIGTVEELQLHVICGPDMRPDCLPSATVGEYFGLSLWKQEESTVEYTVVNVDSSEIGGWNVTNVTTTLSSIWLDVLDCQSAVTWIMALIVSGILFCIGCLSCPGCFLWTCYHVKRYIPRISYQQLIQVLMIGRLHETAHEDRFVLLENGNNENAVSASLDSSEVHQNELPNPWPEGNLEFPAGRVSSMESVHPAVLEKGPRRHAHGTRFVTGKRPPMGYSTDSTSTSGADTNDASDVESRDEAGSHANGRLSTSSTFCAVAEEAADDRL